MHILAIPTLSALILKDIIRTALIVIVGGPYLDASMCPPRILKIMFIFSFLSD